MGLKSPSEEADRVFHESMGELWSGDKGDRDRLVAAIENARAEGAAVGYYHAQPNPEHYPTDLGITAAAFVNACRRLKGL